ncbi:MAG: holo-ACP synthase [Syntrophorhabdaceae bacterium]|nr:holo-ACP synthase [Syntrophorhabdaceae bacterium]
MSHIIGIGVDIVEISRIKSILKQHGEHFISRVFTENEKKYSMSAANSAERFAGRFAVKEAVIKALGIGVNTGITWHDIETIRGASGKPSVRLRNQALRFLKQKGGGGNAIHVSIAHDGGKAIAFVVMERAEEKK